MLYGQIFINVNLCKLDNKYVDPEEYCWNIQTIFKIKHINHLKQFMLRLHRNNS